MKNINTKAALLCAALAIGMSAHAKGRDEAKPKDDAKPTHAAKGPRIGNASVDDVTLATTGADRIAFSTANPMQHGGNASGFSSTFAATAAGPWDVLGTLDGSKLTDSSRVLDFSFASATATSGTWTVTNTSSTKNVVLDLVLAIHASNASTAFLFDDQALAAGQTLGGTWRIEWLNNGGQVPGFSNAVFFGRDMTTSDVTLLPVPEPAALPMMLAGVAVLGAAAWRRRGKRQ